MRLLGREIYSKRTAVDRVKKRENFKLKRVYLRLNLNEFRVHPRRLRSTAARHRSGSHIRVQLEYIRHWHRSQTHSISALYTRPVCASLL